MREPLPLMGAFRKNYDMGNVFLIVKSKKTNCLIKKFVEK